MQNKAQTWKDVVADALQELGGQAHTSQINELIEEHPKTANNPTWQATIRRVVRQYKIFEPVSPDRSGVYRLVEREIPIPQSQDIDSKDSEINHGIAQGMLVTLGDVYGYDTFVPAHDQTTREFQDKKLGDLVSIRSCNTIFHGPNLPKIREIDVLWLDEDDHVLFPVYAFEVEHTTRVRSGLDRLLKIPRRFSVQFFVIGPSEKERKIFDHLVKQTPFRHHQDKFTFRLYSQLQDIYNVAIQHTAARDSFGVIERYRRKFVSPSQEVSAY